MPIINADCIEHMNTMPPESVDSIVTDPPYHLTSKNGQSKGFMGKVWDGGDIAFRTEVWEAALRVAKPGAHLLAFGGTRTFHRMAVAIEDAGWEIRDTVMWVYGSGFPKSHDVGKGIDKAAGVEFEAKPASGVGFMGPDGPGGYNVTKNRLTRTGEATDAAKQWQGWGTALKPAWEPIIVARKPLEGTVAANVLAHGTGALNIDGCRVGTDDSFGGGTKGTSGFAAGYEHDGWKAGSSLGRWPANLIHDGSDEVVGLFPVTTSGSGNKNTGNRNGLFGKGLGAGKGFGIGGDTGSAARFFYCAKASRNDRNEGLEEFEDRKKVFNGKAALPSPSNDVEGSVNEKFSTHPQKNHHPTVKPTALMRYLCKLVTRLGGTVLDPFCGSGSTGKAAILEGFRFIGIEKEFEYCEIANARISKTDM